MEICQRCNKREAITVIGGRKLCEYCARDEIIKRVRREIYDSKQFSYNDKVAIIIEEEFGPLSALLKFIIDKACYKCKLIIDEVKVNVQKDNINDIIWNMIIEAEKLQHKIKVLPFTSDFLLSYLIYSISSQDSNYLSFAKVMTIFNNNIFFIPLYSTSINELKGFAEIKLRWRDEMFNKIYEWTLSYLQENYELFHTFHSSIKLFQGKTCKLCNAFINEGEYCQRCNKILASLSRPY
ncbi:hypothetical protein SJAV_22530 [Sulfurisphaera javensis]|uniref:Uncharacterized protein n=1 Tax=Sulfurisphaera javensis TaxID=2049879 RepID=A0AAT9GTU2_9CREN